MKNQIILILFVIVTSSCGSKSVNENQVSETKYTNGVAESTFKVWGNCGMCEETIETSVKIDGVTEACWNSETKIMTVSYDTSKISLDQIHKNIAGVGYDTEKYTGVEYIEPRIYLCLEAVLIICKF